MASSSAYGVLMAPSGPGGALTSIHPAERSGNSITWRLPPELGSGHFKTECLPYGLTMTISRCRLNNGLYARLMDDTDDLALVFTLRGRSLNINSYFKQGVEMEAGFNCLCWFPDPETVRQAPKGECLEAVALTIPLDRLACSGLIEPTTHSLWETLKKPRERQDAFCFVKNINSPAMDYALTQILQCRYQGQARRLFLEAKALELFALKLNMLTEAPGQVEGVSGQLMQNILACRDLLLKDPRNPPSIHDLARAAGMSHPRLIKYFKIVFGCSPFELLRQKRLEWSLELVAADDLSLTEIAYAAGYANSSHFSKAFLDYYGIQPSRYRKETAGNPFYSLPSPKSAA